MQAESITPRFLEFCPFFPLYNVEMSTIYVKRRMHALTSPLVGLNFNLTQKYYESARRLSGFTHFDALLGVITLFGKRRLIA